MGITIDELSVDFNNYLIGSPENFFELRKLAYFF